MFVCSQHATFFKKTAHFEKMAITLDLEELEKKNVFWKPSGVLNYLKYLKKAVATYVYSDR